VHFKIKLLIVLIKNFHFTLYYFPSFAKILESSIHSPLELSLNYFSSGIEGVAVRLRVLENIFGLTKNAP